MYILRVHYVVMYFKDGNVYAAYYVVIFFKDGKNVYYVYCAVIYFKDAANLRPNSALRLLQATSIFTGYLLPLVIEVYVLKPEGVFSETTSFYQSSKDRSITCRL